MQAVQGWKLLDRQFCRFAPNRFSSSEVDTISSPDAGGSARKLASPPSLICRFAPNRFCSSDLATLSSPSTSGSARKSASPPSPYVASLQTASAALKGIQFPARRRLGAQAGFPPPSPVWIREKSAPVLDNLVHHHGEDRPLTITPKPLFRINKLQSARVQVDRLWRMQRHLHHHFPNWHCASAAGARDRGFGIIRHRQLQHTSVELQSVDVRLQQITKLLGKSRFFAALGMTTFE
jgi:hypothetical protein